MLVQLVGQLLQLRKGAKANPEQLSGMCEVVSQDRPGSTHDESLHSRLGSHEQSHKAAFADLSMCTKDAAGFRAQDEPGIQVAVTDSKVSRT